MSVSVSVCVCVRPDGSALVVDVSYLIAPLGGEDNNKHDNQRDEDEDAHDYAALFPTN